MFESALRVFEENGPWALISFLAGEGPAEAVAETYSRLLLELYWKRKDLPAVVVAGSAGYQQALHAAKKLAAAEPEKAARLEGRAKALIYNVASFCWDGWDEPGIEIGPAERAVGLAAARENLALSVRLGRPEFPLRKGYWMLGAHELSHGRYQDAIEHFAESSRRAQDDGAESEALLAASFRALAAALSRPGREEESSLPGLLQELSKQEHGAEYVAQVETARRVFER